MRTEMNQEIAGPDTVPTNIVPGSQSVYRAIHVLRSVAKANETGITASVLSGHLGLTLATTHRLLKVLVSEGLLAFDPYSKLYNLGLELFIIGHAAHDFRVRDLLAGHMQRLRNITGETVLLLMRSGNDALCIERLEGDFPVRALTLVRGSRRPLGIGAAGIALLAAESDAIVNRIIESNSVHFRDYPGITIEDIRQQVTEARARGFSFNDGRMQDSVRAVGMATGPAGTRPIAAISIAVSSERLITSRRQELEHLLQETFSRVDWGLLRYEELRKPTTEETN